METTRSLEQESKDRCVRVFVPSRDIDGRRFDNRQMLERVVDLFIRLFNGCTTYLAKGVWKTESGKVIKESITVVEAYAPGGDFQVHFPQVLDLMKDFKKDYRQDKMAVSLDNRLQLY